MINSLQAGRFLAAMAVVIHHAVLSVSAYVDAPPSAIQAALNYGYLGVDFFFVLSGFIIHYTMNHRPRPALQFARDRVLRIFVPYLPVGLALAVAYSLLPALSDGDRAWGWIPTLTLFPTGLPPALSVAWTLQHELVFYLIYAALFFSGRIGVGLMIWGTAIAAAYFLGSPAVPLAKLVLAPINIEFIAGVAAAAVFLASRPVRGYWALLGAAVFCLLFILSGGDRDASWLVGFAIACVLPWLCVVETAGGFKVPGWVVFGGAASYAIYLTHNPLLSLVSRAIAIMGLGWSSALLIAVVICVLVGAAYHLMWERPIMRRLSRRSPRTSANRAR